MDKGEKIVSMEDNALDLASRLLYVAGEGDEMRIRDALEAMGLRLIELDET